MIVWKNLSRDKNWNFLNVKYYVYLVLSNGKKSQLHINYFASYKLLELILREGNFITGS